MSLTEVDEIVDEKDEVIDLLKSELHDVSKHCKLVKKEKENLELRNSSHSTKEFEKKINSLENEIMKIETKYNELRQAEKQREQDSLKRKAMIQERRNKTKQDIEGFIAEMRALRK